MSVCVLFGSCLGLWYVPWYWKVDYVLDVLRLCIERASPTIFMLILSICQVRSPQYASFKPTIPAASSYPHPTTSHNHLSEAQ